MNFRSDADYLVLAGDFNVDPRDGEVLGQNRPIFEQYSNSINSTLPGHLQNIQGDFDGFN